MKFVIHVQRACADIYRARMAYLVIIRQQTFWAVAPPADSRAHLFGASSRTSWCRLPQTIAETRVPTVRRPSPRRRVAQLGLSRRIGAGQTMGDAILSRDR